MKGQLFVFAGASGSGKSTVCRYLQEQGLGLISVSHTTRQPRANEKEGVDYYFVSKQEFEDLIANDRMAEWATVHGLLYGTSKDWLLTQIKEGTNVFLDIDVQGTWQLQDAFPDVHTTFVLPPSMSVLTDRLKTRGRENEEQIKLRIQTAYSELAHIDKFDYLVVNENLEKTKQHAQAIIKANCDDQSDNEIVDKLKTANQPDLVAKWKKEFKQKPKL